MTNPGPVWAQYSPLGEGTADWRPELVDDENPSHHYAGLFYMGYFFGDWFGASVNWLRDGPLSDYSQPDLDLGNLAAQHGEMLWRGRFSMYALGDILRYSLSVQAYLWPAGYPYR